MPSLLTLLIFEIAAMPPDCKLLTGASFHQAKNPPWLGHPYGRPT